MINTILINLMVILMSGPQLSQPINADGLSFNQDSKATFYFYRPKKFASSSAKIIVGTKVPDEVVLHLKNGRWMKVDYTALGQRDFVAGVYAINPETFTMDVKAGEIYYVRCTVLPKGLKIMANLEIVDEETAKKEMSSLKEQTSTYVDD